VVAQRRSRHQVAIKQQIDERIKTVCWVGGLYGERQNIPASYMLF